MNTIIKRRPNTASENLPLIERLFCARGVSGIEASGLSDIPPFDTLHGIHDAATLIADAIETGRHIRIIGDYDVDGATSTALVYRALALLGAKRVSFAVPNRITQGYGLSPALVQDAARDEARLLITVDNGISAFEGVDTARYLGLQVVITDHHLPGERLPNADAIVNPAIPGQDFPSRSLAGVGVAFYVMAAARAELDSRGAFAGRDKPSLSSLLDLVALGTVADVVKLDSLNRTLVRAGLRRIRHGMTATGLRALVDVAGRDITHLSETDLAFGVAPRLNAAGRLDDMTLGIECLLATDTEQARCLAGLLDITNQRRREIEQTMRAEALAECENLLDSLNNETPPPGLCVFQNDWHEGVVGLVAGKLKERFHRPAVAFAPGADGMLKGSARSIPGIHIRDVLADIESRSPGLLPKFGGHAMAAGLSIDAERLDTFRPLWETAIAERADPHAFEPVILTDGELAPDDLSLASAIDIEAAGPWGQGFPEPLFDGEFTVTGARIIGKEGNHLRLDLLDPRSGKIFPSVAFNHADIGLDDDPRGQSARFVYRLSANRFRGDVSLQLMVEAYDLPVAP
ncbi:single-stranded-DNA-specific exonuclease RecJ [Acidihalobacter prosperus]|uniref:Single-stranded-DNA-specific exonuclease RecJ n=1 Tax=Acidihalobacter prosperus TaxID=160660 RepID=A0A1A6C346_9GAMM|nr:single-stranded-DNA-specific exonuclease RecJ [Acidihalobacter prosperus]OBS08979.1 Single-stranded-DNA-specific exonuclease RecJ [Acidihalobacter prosperus]